MPTDEAGKHDRGWACVVEASTCDLCHLHAIFRIIALVIGDPVNQSVNAPRTGWFLDVNQRHLSVHKQGMSGITTHHL